VLQREGEREVYQVTKRAFGSSGAATRTILTLHPVTAEILREEVIAYKKLLRVLGHELNNSLAPVASLSGTGKRIVSAGPHPELGELFDTIGERVEHLRTFLLRYAELARLPHPRSREVELGPTLAHVARLFPGIRVSTAGPCAFCDEAQVQQLLVNLVKNAIEAGSPNADIEVNAAVRQDGTLGMTISDRGRGLSDEELVAALVPFFTTKPGGTGLGLAVCREIVEAHGGRLRLRNREGGGAEVIVRIPGREREGSAGLSWTLTRP
jgi:signal transduction histidine kinase